MLYKKDKKIGPQKIINYVLIKTRNVYTSVLKSCFTAPTSIISRIG